MIVDTVRVISCGGGGGGGGNGGGGGGNGGGGAGGGSDGTMTEEEDTLRPPFTPPEAAVEATATPEARLMHQDAQSNKTEAPRQHQMQQREDCVEKGQTVDYKVREGVVQ